MLPLFAVLMLRLLLLLLSVVTNFLLSVLSGRFSIPRQDSWNASFNVRTQSPEAVSLGLHAAVQVPNPIPQH